jgi:hypothetical protein
VAAQNTPRTSDISIDACDANQGEVPTAVAMAKAGSGAYRLKPNNNKIAVDK